MSSSIFLSILICLINIALPNWAMKPEDDPDNNPRKHKAFLDELDRSEAEKTFLAKGASFFFHKGTESYFNNENTRRLNNAVRWEFKRLSQFKELPDKDKLRAHNKKVADREYACRMHAIELALANQSDALKRLKDTCGLFPTTYELADNLLRLNEELRPTEEKAVPDLVVIIGLNAMTKRDDPAVRASILEESHLLKLEEYHNKVMKEIFRQIREGIKNSEQFEKLQKIRAEIEETLAFAIKEKLATIEKEADESKDL